MCKPPNPPEEMVAGSQKGTRLGDRLVVAVLELSEQDREYGLPEFIHLTDVLAASVVPMLAEAVTQAGVESTPRPSRSPMSDKAAEVSLTYLLGELTLGDRDPDEVIALVTRTAEAWGQAQRETNKKHKPRIDVTLQLPVMPSFTISDDGGIGEKGCLTLLITTTRDTELTVCFDGHYKQPLTDLGEAITRAGGVKATGELSFGRTVFNDVLVECGHFLEADTIEPWSPGEAK